jgi:hypothetical protein
MFAVTSSLVETLSSEGALSSVTKQPNDRETLSTWRAGSARPLG